MDMVVREGRDLVPLSYRDTVEELYFLGALLEYFLGMESFIMVVHFGDN